MFFKKLAITTIFATSLINCMKKEASIEEGTKKSKDLFYQYFDKARKLKKEIQLKDIIDLAASLRSIGLRSGKAANKGTWLISREDANAIIEAAKTLTNQK